MIFQYFSKQIYFSRIFQESPLNSSTFQACVNPILGVALSMIVIAAFNGHIHTAFLTESLL